MRSSLLRAAALVVIAGAMPASAQLKALRFGAVVDVGCPLSDGWNVADERNVFRLLLNCSQAQGMRMRRQIIIPAALLAAVLAISGGLAAA